MSSTYGDNLKLSIFGQSHGPAIGMTLDGIPAGQMVDPDTLQAFLNRRAPGQNDWSTPRREEDHPEFLSGLVDGYTCGAPIAAVIHNKNTWSADYSELKDRPRPGHADYTAHIKYGGYQDAAGGGHFSGRLTAPVCIAGGLCLQWLEAMGIRIRAHIASIGSVLDVPFDPIAPQLDMIHDSFPVLSEKSGHCMKTLIDDARSRGDSIGGVIECAVTGLPAGIGEPMFGGMESKIAQIVYGIPAVKGVEFGLGFRASQAFGSENNDAFTFSKGNVVCVTNHSGGILGGISTGMPILFRAAIKPTPSIGRTQQTISFSSASDTTLEVRGRHDPCIVPRAVPVVEAAAAIAIYDLILGNTQITRRK